MYPPGTTPTIPFGADSAEQSRARALLCHNSLRAFYRRGGRIDSNYAELSGSGLGGAVPSGTTAFEMCLNGQLGMRCTSGYFGSVGNFASSSGGALTGDPAFTIAIWLEFVSMTEGGICGWGNALTALEACGLYYWNSKLALGFAGGNDASTTFVFETGRHYFVCATKTPGAIAANTTIYVDGKNAGTVSGSSNTPAITDTVFSMGRWAAYDGWGANIRVSQCMVWDRVLTAGDVYALHQCYRHR